MGILTSIAVLGAYSLKQTAKTKYCATVRGGFTSASFKNYRLPTSIVSALVSAGIHSLAKSTWETYKTAERHLQRCEGDTGVKIRFPMDDRMILAYVGWLISVRKVSAVSIKKYLSGLRTVHLKNGCLPKNLRPDIVNSIIKGREQEEIKDKVPRLAMTIPVLKLLKKLITMSEWSLERKRRMWVVCCLAFHGSFRIHELLSKDKHSFDPTTTLLGRDVKLIKTTLDGRSEEILVVHLKSPKEDHLGQGVRVELFSTDTFSCPVEAWKRWRSLVKGSPCPTKPVFTTEEETCMTGRIFNEEIKTFLGRFINYDHGKYLSHSFCSGMASMMASAGYRDEDIMRQGRWNSRAFLTYCKTGRAIRLREQRELARTLANISKC